MKFTVNETASGIVAPPKDICKVQGCKNSRFKCKRPYAFCKTHSGLRTQMSSKRFRDLAGNSELVVLDAPWPNKKKGMTSKRKKARLFRKQCIA